MDFKITLHNIGASLLIPVNYQYSLSTALYRIIAGEDACLIDSLHETDSIRGFSLFTFSEIETPFRVNDDRLQLLSKDISFRVSFHLPDTMADFIKGLFQYEKIDISDNKSQATFMIKSIENVPNILLNRSEDELIRVVLKPNSPIVAGILNENRRYQYLSPEDSCFEESLIHNWRSKIVACYDENLAKSALLFMKAHSVKLDFEPRLMTFKAGDREETKVKGWINLEIEVAAEKRFLELLLNAGIGMYNAFGCGSVEIKTECVDRNAKYVYS